MLSHELPIDGVGEGSVFLQPRCLDKDDVVKRVQASNKARRFKPQIKAKLARLYFIPRQLADSTPSGQKRKTGTEILSRLTCKSCQRVFHKRTGLRVHSCKRPSTMQHKPTKTKGKDCKNSSANPGKKLRNSWPSRKSTKRKHNLALVSCPAKTPCIEEKKKTKERDGEDEEVVILWQG